jgi:hypothetical protein
MPFPAQQQHPELGSPIPKVIVRHDAVAQDSKGAGQAVAQSGGTNVANMHWLGHIGRAEINDDGAGLSEPPKKKMLTAGSGGEHFADGGWLQPKIEKPCSGDVDALAALAHVQPAFDLLGKLAGIQSALPGQADERVGLIITKLRVWAGTDQNACEVGTGKDRCDCLLEALFDLAMKHVLDWLNDSERLNELLGK